MFPGRVVPEAGAEKLRPNPEAFTENGTGELRRLRKCEMA